MGSIGDWVYLGVVVNKSQKMKPSQIINSIVLSIVILVMSIIINLFLPNLNNDKYEIAISIFSSASLYVFLTSFLNYLFNNIQLMKKALLGRRFLEGTWIGSFEGKNGEKRILVEIFSQTLEETQITGESFDLNGVVLGRWKSETTSINSKKSTLIYSYQCEVLRRKESYSGIAKFNIQKSEKASFPNSLRGYSADLIDGKRQNSIEYKLSDKEIDFEVALKKALDKYK